MPFQPETITKQHVLKAVQTIDSGDIGIRPSTKFDVIINGKAYPPKDIMRLAHEEATGEYLWQPRGGEPTNKYLTALGFEIREKDKSNFNRDSSFYSFMEQLDKVLITRRGSPRFTIMKETYGKSRNREWFWLKDEYGIIGDTIAHYEVEYDQKIISVCIHFEDSKNNKEFRNKIGEKLSYEIEWFKWFNAWSVKYSEQIKFDVEVKKTIDKVLYSLNYLDSRIGFKVRDIKNEISIRNAVKNVNQPLNQILFGPPGTGKTYHTMNKALEIIGVDTSLLDRKSIKEEFEKRSAVGQIVFTTFHQSMGYEDFIEGIKPNVESDENESIKYKIEDGILKRLCRKAITEYYKEDTGNKKISTVTDRLQLYDEAWDHLVNAVQKSLDDGKPLELLSLSGKSLDVIKNHPTGQFNFETPG
jgi:hypothetical protein